MGRGTSSTCSCQALQRKRPFLNTLFPTLSDDVPKLQIRIAKSLLKKPWTSRQKKVDNAFADEDPDFNLGLVGPDHRLILNKFSVVRPQFVLPTIEFEPQNEPLTATDLGAAWEVLSSLESEYMIIFNCGADAGASVGHKHLQVLPCPDPKEHTLFPETNLLNEGP